MQVDLRIVVRLLNLPIRVLDKLTTSALPRDATGAFNKADMLFFSLAVVDTKNSFDNYIFSSFSDVFAKDYSDNLKMSCFFTIPSRK